MSHHDGSRTGSCVRALICMTLAAAAACLLAGARPAIARTGTPDVWESLGPETGTVLDLVPVPATAGGFYALPLANPNSRVFRSDDDGDSWRVAFALDVMLMALELEPGHPDTIYAAGLDLVHRSFDGGETWSARRLHPSWSCQVRDLLALPDGSGTLLAGAIPLTSFAPIVFRSVDRGSSWTTVVLDTWGQGGYVTALRCDPARPDTVYAVGVWASSTGETLPAVWRSEDGGMAWTQLASPPKGIQLVDLQVMTSGPDTLFAAGNGGVFRSDDRGASWAGVLEVPIAALALDPDHPGTVLAAGEGLFFRSDDGGASWQDQTGGLPEAPIARIAFRPGDPATTHLGAGCGILRSQGSPAVWRLRNAGFDAAIVSALTAAPSAPDVLYAAVMNDAVYRSDDGGATWLRLGNFFGCGTVAALAVHPEDAWRVFAFSGG